jgi:RimJ/RimL family protein N-acetyltransferase
MHTLDSPRLSLRMFRESDLDAYAEMCGDPNVMRFLGDGHTLTRPEAWRNMALVLGHWQLRGFGLWAVEERATGLLAGRVGCWRPEGWPGLEIGWALRRPFWGRGYATEAALAALNYAFHRLKQSHVISLIHPDNGPSIAVALRLGMRMEGYTQVMDHSVLIYGIDSVSRLPLTQ